MFLFITFEERVEQTLLTFVSAAEVGLHSRETHRSRHLRHSPGFFTVAFSTLASDKKFVPFSTKD